MHNRSAGPPYGTAPPLDNFMLPKRRFWKEEQKMTSIFSIDFSMVHSPNRVLTPLKSASFENTDCIFCSSFQNLRLGSINFNARNSTLLVIFIAYQNTCFCCYLVLLSTFSNHFRPRPENATFCSPQWRPVGSLHCNFMLPKRRFWKAELTFQNVFSKHFSTILSPNRVLTPLKSASKTHSETLVPPSKIFVWEG